MLGMGVHAIDEAGYTKPLPMAEDDEPDDPPRTVQQRSRLLG